MKVAALGRTRWLYDSIRAVIQGGHEIVLIGTCPAAPEYVIDERAFKILADELGCLYFCSPTLNHPKYINLAFQSGAEVAISVNWLTLIGQRMLNQFEHGIINVHAGDLPRFRGNAVANWAILTGEDKIVLTWHKMVAELDAGPILWQREFPLDSNTYIADVYHFLSENIPEVFVKILNQLEQLVPQEQSINPRLSLRCFPRLPRDGWICWDLSAQNMVQLIRASAEPFAGAYTFIGTEKLIVWRARASELPYRDMGMVGQVAEIRKDAGEVIVLTGSGVLILEEVETATKGRGRAADIIKSIRTRLGMDVTQEIMRLNERVAKLESCQN